MDIGTSECETRNGTARTMERISGSSKLGKW